MITKRNIAIAFAVTLVVSFGVLALLANIFERKQEARDPFFRVVEVGEFETDPAVWGKNFPDQYDMWRNTTVDYGNTEFGGSGMRDKLEENPNLLRLYAGYPFSIEYNDERGHGWSLTDVREIKRLGDQKPGTCMTCKSSDNVRLMAEMGVKEFYNTKMKDLPNEHPISCLNCHDPQTMNLRVTNPAFIEAMEARGIDLGKATRQEMRSYVCGQCHAEYYFESKENPYLHFPWKYGLSYDDMEKFYDELNFHDWIHPDSGAPIVKYQHPDFELWSTGIHAKSGVSCADCHMPFKRVGSQKISDHWVRSPLVNVAAACQTCHRWSEQELTNRVLTIQRRTRALMERSEIAIIAAIDAIKNASDRGVSDADLAEARRFHRMAQGRWDYVQSENSMGFHSPQESARLLGEAIDYARQGEASAIRASFGQGRATQEARR